MSTKPVLEQEYVYTTDTTGEFRTVIISLDVTEMKEIITLRPEQNMTMNEIHCTLHGFEEDVLTKMNMTLGENHPVQLEYKGKKFQVMFDDNRKVTGVKPI